MDSTQAQPSRQRRHADLWALALALLCAAVACVLPAGHQGPVQTWWAQRGPVVPHDDFPADCSLCHEGSGWQSIRSDFEYDHEAATGVALVGAHAQALCLRCHNDRGPVALYANRGCAGCHEDPHRGQLGSRCEDCHDQVDFRPTAQIEKHLRTSFPLVGRHAATACWACHPDAQVGNFTRTPTQCVECHADDLARATNPDHVAQGWVQDCQRCHIPVAWSGAAFNHSWPLTGAHKTALCSDCHAGGIYAGTPNQCVDCHLDDYQGAKDPDHVVLNFPTSCEQCHNTSTWEGAQFSHVGIASGCVNCHLDDYQGTNDPNHTVAGFPTTCEACHNTNSWFGATFTHNFPINSGAHSNFDCSDCHLQPSNFANFSCTHCHDHNQSEMGKKHSRVGGYTWVSSACYSCHPDGKH